MKHHDRPQPATSTQAEEKVSTPINSRKLIAIGEAHAAPKVTKHLTKACSDCPLRRDALNGWLGGATPAEYARLCHSDKVVECHAHAGSRCAGLAIYRRNTCKSQPKAHELPPDRESIFSNRMEFLEHHSAEPGWRAKRLEPERTELSGVWHPPYTHTAPSVPDWAACQRIAEAPEVDEALRLFAEGETTEDQAVAIVQAVLTAAQAQKGGAT